tara:strand:+ start:921 stop:1091 length:171 start_codon:yes stop_codon:yes gene_type:complete
MTYTYKKIIDPLTKKESTNTILRKEDNAFIPFDENNTEYQAYLAWVAEGNTAEAAD